MASPEASLSYRNLVLETFEATGLPVTHSFIGGSGALALWGELNRAPNDLDICVDPLYFASDALRRTTPITPTPNTGPRRVEVTFCTPNNVIELRPKERTAYFGLIKRRPVDTNAPLQNTYPMPNSLLDLDIHTTAPDPEHIMNLGLEPADLTSMAHRKFRDEYGAASTDWVGSWSDMPQSPLRELRVMRPENVHAGKRQRPLFSGQGNVFKVAGRLKRLQDWHDKNPTG